MKTIKLSNGVEVRNDIMGKETSSSRWMLNADYMRKINKRRDRKKPKEKKVNGFT